MKVLLVYCHPEANSFGAALRDRGVEALRAEGHDVVVSDLYAMGFSPVASASDFLDRRLPDRLQYDREQKHAMATQGFTSDISAEIEKLQWCDTLVLQFPLWWFSLPAMLKGWVDRCFANGLAYGGGRRMDEGGLRGRRAMLAFTTACLPDMAAPDGVLGDMQVTLWHLHSGTLAYSGFEVLPPFIAWSSSHVDDARRQTYLDAYAAQLCAMEQTDPLFFHPLAHFQDWRLRPEIAPRTVGQRRMPEA